MAPKTKSHNIENTTPNDKLATLVFHLPQELIDAIYALTLPSLLHSNRQIELSGGYTPPAALHINRSTRAAFAPGFYSATIFHSRKECLITRWLASLPPEHRKLLRTVRLIRPPPMSMGKAKDGKKACQAVREFVAGRLRSEGIEVGDLGFLTVWT